MHCVSVFVCAVKSRPDCYRNVKLLHSLRPRKKDHPKQGTSGNLVSTNGWHPMGTHKWRHLVCFIWEIPGYPEVSSFPALFWNLLHKSGSLTIHPQSSHDPNNLENRSHTQSPLWIDISAKWECCWLASLWASDLTCFTPFIISSTSQNCSTTTGITASCSLSTLWRVRRLIAAYFI